jgi:hypothetical protein
MDTVGSDTGNSHGVSLILLALGMNICNPSYYIDLVLRCCIIYRKGLLKLPI